LIEPVAHWDVKVGNLPVVEGVAYRRLIEGGLIMEHMLLKVVKAVFVLLVCNSGGGFSVGNGLKEAVGDASEQGGVDVGL
jgi:hypothetical protein